MTLRAAADRDLVREMIQGGLVSVDPSITDPVRRTTLLMIGIERWWTHARQVRQIVHGKGRSSP